VRRPSDLLSRTGSQESPVATATGYKIHVTRVKYKILAVTVQEKERTRESHDEPVTLSDKSITATIKWEQVGRPLHLVTVIVHRARYWERDIMDIKISGGVTGT
jgi:hypothetical protein